MHIPSSTFVAAEDKSADVPGSCASTLAGPVAYLVAIIAGVGKCQMLA